MLEMVIPARRRSLGGGFEVGRVLPFARRRMVGPFVFYDHMGPMDLAAGIGREVDVRPHPHIGLSTVTYLFAGELMHRDSVGSVMPIRPAELNWMTAGSGIVHSERFERARAQGDRLHGIQAWVALPEADEETDPGFAHHEGADLPTWAEAGARGRLVAGTGWGLRAAVRTHCPLVYAHLELDAGARAELPRGHQQRAVHVVEGAVEVGDTVLAAGEMGILRPDADALRAVTASTVMVLGGADLGPRHLWWNFVSSSAERLAQAAEDWKAGRMALPQADSDEFIPLPDAPPLPRGAPRAVEPAAPEPPPGPN
jgi:redox-sensitive bicupin YhaK (pirin superfamily)